MQIAYYADIQCPHWYLSRISTVSQWRRLTMEIISSHLHSFQVRMFRSMWFKAQLTLSHLTIQIYILHKLFIIILSSPSITLKIVFFTCVRRNGFCFTFTFYIIIFIKINFTCWNIPKMFINKLFFSVGEMLSVSTWLLPFQRSRSAPVL